MSLYAEYLKEKTGDGIVETKDGFATFRYTDFKGEKAVYIIDLYVVPQSRKKNVASSLADEIIGLSLDCKHLLGSVIPSNKGSNESLKVLLAYGMSIDSCSMDFILFKKELT